MKKRPNKKRVIKWENVILIAYIIITLFKYFMTPNFDILILLYDLTIDSLLALFLYGFILVLRKGEIE